MEKPKVTPELIDRFLKYASADAGPECCDGDFDRLNSFLVNNAEALCAIINNDYLDQIHLLKSSTFSSSHSTNRPDLMSYEFKDIITITGFTTKLYGGISGECNKLKNTSCWLTREYGNGMICPICGGPSTLLENINNPQPQAKDDGRGFDIINSPAITYINDIRAGGGGGAGGVGETPPNPRVYDIIVGAG